MRFLFWLVLAVNVLMFILNIMRGSPFVLISVIGIVAAVVALHFDSKARASRRRVEALRSGWDR